MDKGNTKLPAQVATMLSEKETDIEQLMHNMYIWIKLSANYKNKSCLFPTFGLTYGETLALCSDLIDQGYTVTKEMNQLKISWP